MSRDSSFSFSPRNASAHGTVDRKLFSPTLWAAQPWVVDERDATLRDGFREVDKLGFDRLFET